MNFSIAMLCSMIALPSVIYSMEGQNKKRLWSEDINERESKKIKTEEKAIPEYIPKKEEKTTSAYTPASVRGIVDQPKSFLVEASDRPSVQNNAILDLPNEQFFSLLNKTNTLSSEQKHDIRIWYLTPLPTRITEIQKYYQKQEDFNKNPEVSELACRCFKEKFDDLQYSLKKLRAQYAKSFTNTNPKLDGLYEKLSISFDAYVEKVKKIPANKLSFQIIKHDPMWNLSSNAFNKLLNKTNLTDQEKHKMKMLHFMDPNIRAEKIQGYFNLQELAQQQGKNLDFICHSNQIGHINHGLTEMHKKSTGLEWTEK